MSIKKLIFFCLIAAFIVPAGYTQDHRENVLQLTSGLVNDLGVLHMGSSRNWKYHPGDDISWADPDFDDSDWFAIEPTNLPIDAMPDNLWDGYGWWRLSFTADSTFYVESWNLYFNGWGAAEIYLDGKLVHRFGNFSTNPADEKTIAPIYQIFPPVVISKHETHTLAVRYSYHQAKQYNFFMRESAGNLGFLVGFSTHSFNEYRAEVRTYMAFVLFASGAVLFVLLLLHLMLFYKFPKDRTNLYLSVVIGLLLVSNIAIYNPVYANLNRYWYLVFEMIWAYSSSFSFLFIPYTLVCLFRLDKLKKVIWLLATYPFLIYATFLSSAPANYFALAVFFVSFTLVSYICLRAYKLKKKGVSFIAFGVFGSSCLVIVYMLYILGYIGLDPKIFYVVVTFLYTLFPVGLTLYVADRYGYLFSSMEQEVSDRTKELQQSYYALEDSLNKLQSTQEQLIQQEKLASLGQLTAGIAHEIKNPLNFVNNFSDVNLEMIDEIREEINSVKANHELPLQNISEILDDVEANLRKIHEHGSRADGIVKSMLQHSRDGSGEKVPTQLNSMIKEYVNLAFHGMRAGKEPINVDIELNLDENVGEIPLIAEDFSRVILNLCNNAFDAMREKLSEKAKGKSEKSSLEGSGEAERSRGVSSVGDYKPKLTVRTHQTDNGSISIQIEDNGPGIPDEIKDKILQPFFTTKKGTEGTGLGLSITNDIVKAHGGSMNITTDPGAGTVFTITLLHQ